jgi:hypothetical protein
MGWQLVAVRVRMRIVPGREGRLVHRRMGRLGIELLNGMPQGMLWLMGMLVVLGVVEFVLVMPVHVHASFNPEMRSRMGDVPVQGRSLLVSR